MPSPGAPQGAVSSPSGAPAPRTYTVIGDSVMRGALDVLKSGLPGADVDAVEGRQASVAFDIINKLAGGNHLGIPSRQQHHSDLDGCALQILLQRLGG